MAESFADLTLAAPLLAAAEEIGLVAPNEMQSRLIAAVTGGRDVLAVTPAGSGGTTGYLLGLMQLLLTQPPPEGRGPRALILAPTRDQAMQIGRMIKQLGHDTRLRFGTVVGGRPYPTQHQLLRRPLDILVATPGRLMDHIRRGRVPFERLRLLLLDKADQMLDMGLGSEVYSIVDAGGEQLDQTMILSDAPNDAVGLLAARLTQDAESVGQGDPLPQPIADTASAGRVTQEDEDAFEEDDRQPASLAADGERPRGRTPRAKSSSRGARRSGTVGNGAQGGNGKPGASAKPPRGPRTPRQGGGQKSGGQGSSGQAQGGKGSNGKAAKGGLRGPGRRVAGGAQGQGGRGRRPSDVRFPSDYASGPGGAAKAAPVEPRGPQPNEPVQYSADYGFSVAPGARKPVNVVYRSKSRRRREEGDEGDGKAENVTE